MGSSQSSSSSGNATAGQQQQQQQQQQQESTTSRHRSFGDFVASVPLFCRVVFVIFLVVHITYLTGWTLLHRCLDPMFFNWGKGDEDGPTISSSYFMSPLSHANVLHLFLNTIVLLTYVGEVERALGTIGAFILGLLLWLVGTLVTCFIYTFTVGLLFPSTSVCVLGYSGVIFGFVTVHTFGCVPNSRLPFLWLFDVPARVVPFAYMAFVSLLIPQASWGAHLAGVLIGLAVRFVIPRGGLTDPCGIASGSCGSALRGSMPVVFMPPVSEPWQEASEALFTRPTSSNGGGGDGQQQQQQQAAAAPPAQHPV